MALHISAHMDVQMCASTACFCIILHHTAVTNMELNTNTRDLLEYFTVSFRLASYK